MMQVLSPPKLELREILDAAAQHNLPPDCYFSQWEVFSQWQLKALQTVGLQPHHSLLDIGCGAMRLGLAAVEYLDDGNYCGMDAFEPFIRLAQDLARRAHLSKTFSVLHDANFGFHRFGRMFDFAMAQSVLTHLSPADINRCMAALRAVMRPGSKFLFTYLFETSPTVGFMYAGRQLMQRARLEGPSFFQELGDKHGARFEALSLEHPTQKVGLFTF